MFSKTIFISAVVLALGLQVNAHAGVTPALGVAKGFTRDDVQQPTQAKPCGTANLATIDTSTPVTAAADGTMSFKIQNFNPGEDGSRKIAALQIDPTGTGKSFQKAPASAIVKNGDAQPTSVGSQDLTVKMPAGMKCTGGKNGNACLISFTTLGGFGNCAVAVQGGAGKAAQGGAKKGAAGGNSTTSAAEGTKGAAKNDRRAVGTRAARAYLEAVVDLD